MPRPTRTKKFGVPAIPPVVWLIVLANLAVLGAYAVMLPAYRAADEPFHFALVRLVEHSHSYPNYNTAVYDGRVRGSLPLVSFGKRSAHLTSKAAVPRSKRPSFSAIPAAQPPVFNVEAQHPPLYYVVMATGLREAQALVPGNLLRSWDQELAGARLLSALLIAPIPLLVWLTARRLRLSMPAALTATLVPLAIPQLQHLGASVNNDDMLALLAAALTYLVACIATGDTTTRMLVLSGVVTGLALISKAFSFVFPIWVLGAIAIGCARAGKRIRWRDAAIVLGTAFVCGGWWWARNLIKFHSVSPSLDSARFAKAPAGFSPDWVYWWHEAFRRVGLTFWGNFGWYDTHIPVLATVLASALCGVAVLVAFFAPRRASLSSHVPTRTVVLLMLAPLILVGIEVFYSAGSAYAHSSQLPGLQGRYLFSAIPGLAVIFGIAVAGVGQYVPRLVRAAPVVMLGLVVLMHVFAVRAIFGYYWGSASASFADQLRAFIAWCPWSPLWLVTATIVGSVAVIAMVVSVVRASLSPDDMVLRYAGRARGGGAGLRNGDDVAGALARVPARG
jgi:hypothetical protein